MTDNRRRLHAIVSGTVQGVSFRYYTTQQARDLSIVGWVRNNPDGTVELIAEGTQDALTTLETWLHQGSPAARVESVNAEWQQATGDFSKFQTVYFSD